MDFSREAAERGCRPVVCGSTSVNVEEEPKERWESSERTCCSSKSPREAGDEDCAWEDAESRELFVGSNVNHKLGLYV